MARVEADQLGFLLADPARAWRIGLAGRLRLLVGKASESPALEARS